eukprot:Nk52_evm48s236 gene=Nk52_evmTU48s236
MMEKHVDSIKAWEAFIKKRNSLKQTYQKTLKDMANILDTMTLSSLHSEDGDLPEETLAEYDRTLKLKLMKSHRRNKWDASPFFEVRKEGEATHIPTNCQDSKIYQLQKGIIPMKEIETSRDLMTCKALTREEIRHYLESINEPVPTQTEFPRTCDHWLTNIEIASYLISFDMHSQWIAEKVMDNPPNGSVFLFDRSVHQFRRDKYDWRKRKGAKTVREDHMKLKVGGMECLYGCYVHLESDPTFHRRTYWLMTNPNIVFVHYLRQASSKRNTKKKIPSTEPSLPHQADATDGAACSETQPSHPLIIQAGPQKLTTKKKKVAKTTKQPRKAKGKKAGAEKPDNTVQSSSPNIQNSEYPLTLGGVDNVFEYPLSQSEPAAMEVHASASPNQSIYDSEQSNIFKSPLSLFDPNPPAFVNSNNKAPELSFTSNMSMSPNTFHGFSSEETGQNSFPACRSTMSSPSKRNPVRNASANSNSTNGMYIPNINPFANSLRSSVSMPFPPSMAFDSYSVSASSNPGMTSMENSPVLQDSPLLGSSCSEQQMNNMGMFPFRQFNQPNVLIGDDMSNQQVRKQFSNFSYSDSVSADSNDYSNPILRQTEQTRGSGELQDITDYCPDWSFCEGGTKVLITGPFRFGNMYTCVFGNETVCSSVISDGILRCLTPACKKGSVGLYVQDGSGKTITKTVNFTFKETTIAPNNWLIVNDPSKFKMGLLRGLEKVELFVKMLNGDKSMTLDSNGNFAFTSEEKGDFMLKHYRALFEKTDDFEEVTVNFCENLFHCVHSYIYKHFARLYDGTRCNFEADCAAFAKMGIIITRCATTGQINIRYSGLEKIFRDSETSLTLLHFACALGHSRIVSVIVSWISRIKDNYDDAIAFVTSNFYGPEGPLQDKSNFQYISATKDVEIKKGIYELLKRCVCIISTDKCLCTPLMWACAVGHLNTAQVLLAYDEDDLPSLQIRDQWARLPLEVAYDNGHFELVSAIQDQLNIWNSDAIHIDAEVMSLDNSTYSDNNEQQSGAGEFAVDSTPDHNFPATVTGDSVGNGRQDPADASSSVQSNVDQYRSDGTAVAVKTETDDCFIPDGRKSLEIEDILASAGYNALEKNFSELTIEDGDPFIIFKSARIIQKAFRKYKNGQKYSSDSLNAAVLIQRAYKSYQNKKQDAAQRIQNQYRVYRENIKLNEIQQAAQIIQRKYRFLKSRSNIRKRSAAAKKIQKFMRANLG